MLLCFVSFALVVHAMNTVVVHQWETGHIGFSCKTCSHLCTVHSFDWVHSYKVAVGERRTPIHPRTDPI